MAHTPTAAAPATPMSLTHLVIPHEQLAAAIRAAFDTLVALLNDKKAHLRERRLAAVAILRLASPPAPSQRTRSGSDVGGGPPHNPSPPSAPTPRAPDAGPESAKVRVPAPQPPPSPSCSEEGEGGGGRGEGSVPTTPSSLPKPIVHPRALRAAKLAHEIPRAHYPRPAHIDSRRRSSEHDPPTAPPSAPPTTCFHSIAVSEEGAAPSPDDPHPRKGRAIEVGSSDFDVIDTWRWHRSPKRTSMARPGAVGCGALEEEEGVEALTPTLSLRQSPKGGEPRVCVAYRWIGTPAPPRPPGSPTGESP